MRLRSSREFRQWLALPVDGQASPGEATDVRLPVLVVGAGPAGLAVMAALKREGIAFTGIDSHHGIGGIWDESNPLSSVYEGMRTVTSRFTTHLGPPMPKGWPHFVPHAQAREYLRDFSEQEGLRPHLQLGTRFVDAVKSPRGTWMAKLQTSDGRETFEREYRAIVIATGSHNKNQRAVPQQLWDEAARSGLDVCHSADYAEAERYAGKRVLVVGIGNSGTDIADKVSAVAKRTLLSVRTPPWINPATMFGTPCDKMAADSTWLPHWYQVGAFHIIRRLAIGSVSRLGLVSPSHPLLDRVPVTDRGIVRALLDGRVAIRSHVTSIVDGIAKFEDPRQPDEPVDAVVFATGYRRRYPLLPETNGDGEPRSPSDALTYFVFHRTEPGLAFMTEVVGTWSCWPIFVEQARAIAAYFAAEQRGGRRASEFNARRNLLTPNFKGHLFSGADEFHIDYGLYTRALRELAGWLSE